MVRRLVIALAIYLPLSHLGYWTTAAFYPACASAMYGAYLWSSILVSIALALLVLRHMRGVLWP